MEHTSFTKLVDSCQTNILATVPLYNPDLFLCAIGCLNIANCTGINYWEATQRCDIVSNNSTSHASIVTNISDCQYYVLVRLL
ncbi:mucin-2, partial [Biomphalaria pfeifferi]